MFENRSDESKMIELIKKEIGISVSSLARSVGISPSTILAPMSVGRRKGIGHYVSRFPKITDALKFRARKMSKFRAKDEADIEDLLSECGIPKTLIARKLGCSHQAFSEGLKYGMSGRRLAEVETIIRGLGDKLTRLL